jgi:hypothetical protein
MKPYHLSRKNATAHSNLITLSGNKVAEVVRMLFSTEVIRLQGRAVRLSGTIGTIENIK